MSGPRYLPTVALLLAGCGLSVGCGHSGPQTATRRRLDCNHYGTLAYVKDRIDVRPPKAHRVATYRWSHVSGPSLPLGACRPTRLEVVDFENALPVDGGVPTPQPVGPQGGLETAPPPVPAPQPLLDEEPGQPADALRRDASIEDAHEPTPLPDASARRERIRTSWLFRELD